MTRIIAGTAEGIYAFDARIPLDRPAEGRAAAFGGREVTDLAGDGSELWALIEGSSVHRGDIGGSWTEVGWLDRWRGNCLLPIAAGPLIGTREAHLMRLSEDGSVQVESFERVDGREEWYTPWGGPPDTRSMSADEAGTVYVNVHVGGILRSSDGGASWRPTIDIDSDVHQVLAHPAHPGVVLAATAHGLARSDDGGSSWGFHASGLHAAYSRAVAVSGDHILISASEGPRGGRSAVYRTRAGSPAALERCRQGLPEWFDRNIDTGCLDAAGSMAAFGTADGSVFVSEDEGESWRLVASGLAPVRSLVVA